MVDLPPENEEVQKYVDGFDGQVIVSITADGWLLYPRFKNGSLDNQYMRHTTEATELGYKVLQVFEAMNLEKPNGDDGEV